MKLTKILAAAAVVAIGATAQADDQTSATYCVITLPVAQGYNLYGVAVNPATASTTYGDVFGVSETTTFISTELGNNNSNVEISGAATASQGTAIWYSGATPGFIYQYGLDSEAADTYSFPKGATTLAVFKKPLTLDSFTDAFGTCGTKGYNTAKSNIVSVWNAATQKYVKYYYSVGRGWKIYGSNAAVTASEIAIPVGSVVFVHPSTEFATDSFSLTI